MITRTLDYFIKTFEFISPDISDKIVTEIKTCNWKEFLYCIVGLSLCVLIETYLLPDLFQEGCKFTIKYDNNKKNKLIHIKPMYFQIPMLLGCYLIFQFLVDYK